MTADIIDGKAFALTVRNQVAGHVARLKADHGIIPGLAVWNMQYHVEHHMYPAVPFYNLPKLRCALEHDLPPAPHGLWATWKEILAIKQSIKNDPGYQFIPVIPGTPEPVTR